MLRITLHVITHSREIIVQILSCYIYLLNFVVWWFNNWCTDMHISFLICCFLWYEITVAMVRCYVNRIYTHVTWTNAIIKDDLCFVLHSIGLRFPGTATYLVLFFLRKVLLLNTPCTYLDSSSEFDVLLFSGKLML